MFHKPAEVSAIRSGIHIGSAGWSIPRDQAAQFPLSSSSLERYAAVLTCAEINSTFYRRHRASTYARWFASTPDHFRFAVKLPKAITHECALEPSRQQLQTFLEEVRQLTHKLGPILIQLPPKQSFDRSTATAFFRLLRELHPAGPTALEPRHAGWFSPEADDLLQHFHIARVGADPPRAGRANDPAGDLSLIYYRLHGSPRTYYSSYTADQLSELHLRLIEQHQAAEVWCIFDNTASGAAAENALTLARMMGPVT